MRRQRLDRVGRAASMFLLAGLVVASIGLPGAVAASCPPLAPSEWTSIPVPSFPAGAQAISDYEASPTDGRLVALTNGSVVQMTTDGGCSFRTVFNVDSLSYHREGTVIKDLLVGSNDGRKIYLAVESPEVVEIGQQPLGVSQELGIRPHVVVSDDGGATWVESDQGLDDVLGAPLSLAASPGSASVYLLVDQFQIDVQPVSITTPQTVYVSSDGGAAWVAGQQFGGNAVNPATDNNTFFDRLLSDPVDPNTVWAFGRSGLQQSVDGGANFAAPPFFAVAAAVNVGHLEIYRPSAEVPAQIVATDAGSPRVILSSDGGTAFTPYPVRSIYSSTALFSGTRIAAGTSQGEVLVHFPGFPDPTDITLGTSSLNDVQGSMGDGVEILYSRSASAIHRRALPEAPTIDPPDFPEPPEYDPKYVEELGGLADPERPELLPKQQVVELRPGEQRTLTYQLYLPGVRNVDVVFLFDTSDSMVEEINGLRLASNGIIDVLEREDAHAYYGVGSYRSYGSQPYVNHRDVGPPGPELAAALNELKASGGSDETSLAALYQLATGEGQDEPELGAYIDRNQQMNFRPDALRVVVHGTDEDFTNSPPNPSFAQAAAALNGVRALQVGLAYENSEDALASTAGPPTASLSQMATLTGAISPTDVDCDGDGQQDVAAGQSLVCAIPSADAENPTTIGEAIATMILSLPDTRRVRLEVQGETQVLTGVMPTAGYPAVDFKFRQLKRFDVTVACPLVGSDSDYDMTPVATARGVPIAEAQLKVVCGPPPPRQRAERPTPFLLLPPGQPPPPPQPPQVQSPVQQVQAQTQAQSQAQAQAGLVTQRQAQAQVATVKVTRPSANLARVDAQGADDLAFSSAARRKHSDLPPYLATYVIAAAMGTVFGLLMRVRARRAYITVRSSPSTRTSYQKGRLR